MRCRNKWNHAAVLVVAVVGFGGCGQSQSADSGNGAVADDHDHEHEHGHEGPHGGHVIELGTDNYHAEVTLDDATNTVGVYVLDGAATATAPVVADAVTINAVADGQPQQYTLAAKPREGDPDGKASYFELVDDTLVDGIAGGWDSESAHARLNITIDGTPYVGDVELGDHEHEHADDHEHAQD